jgi:hypothetical protein
MAKKIGRQKPLWASKKALDLSDESKYEEKNHKAAEAVEPWFLCGLRQRIHILR